MSEVEYLALQSVANKLAVKLGMSPEHTLSSCTLREGLLIALEVSSPTPAISRAETSPTLDSDGLSARGRADLNNWIAACRGMQDGNA